MRSTSLLLALAALACSGDQLTAPSLISSRLPALQVRANSDTVFLMGAGDIAGCASSYHDEATARLIRADPRARAFAAGDLAYTYGTLADWACYNASWGQFKDRTWPAIGNHELHDPVGTRHYYDYWNGVGSDSGVAGRRGKAYYAVWHGAWRLLFLNSDYMAGDSTLTESQRHSLGMQEEVAFIKADLTAHPSLCQLAIFHRPRFTSVSDMVPTGWIPPLYKALIALGADIAIGGHHHQYERTAPVLLDGTVDEARGIVQFVAGGGGANSLNNFLATPKPYSRARVKAYGVLWLKLFPTKARFEYRDTLGVVRDGGYVKCH
jgi:hypothetical protein